jgi:cell division septal protein FtsQ
MVKKSNINISAIAVIRTIVFLLIGFIVFTVFTRTVEFLTTSPMFEVKNVLIDSSIQFIDVRSLKQLKGRNIFKVDINKVERQIARDYPYIAQLRVVREFPDRIKVLAKKRDPLMQMSVKGKVLLVDTEGVALFYVAKPVALPHVKGISLDKSRIILGAPLSHQALGKVVEILNLFKKSPFLSKWHINEVDAGNLSKIDLTINSNMHVIVDSDNTESKIGLLQMMIVQNKVDLTQVKYIDVRFKEPVIGANSDNPKGKD